MFYLVSYRSRIDALEETHGRSMRGNAESHDGDAVGSSADTETMVEDIAAFGTASEAFVSVYRMMIGDFEREWFPSSFTLVLFLGYM